jgi:outer membrane immunogenic protein
LGKKEMNKFSKLLAVSLFGISSSVFAQSAFQGFYGQIATGYENNSASNLDQVYKEAARINPDTYNAATQNFSGAPLIIGLGYNFSVAPKFILGVGIDYSFTSQTSSAYNSNFSLIDSSFTGQSLKLSNRLNIFITPGYEIDKDKLIYLKAGYSSIKATYNPPTANDGTPESRNWTTPSSAVGGYIVGLGYKQIIAGGFYGFAEGNYMSYNKPSLVSNVDETPYGGASTWTMTTNPTISTYQLLVGVGYRF